MSLSPGTRIGVYEIVEMIGVGGMGEVYRATDSRLDRPVALKTLPAEFAADADRLARFEREAKLLAQLNHPHIASIYGLEAGAPSALTMELVEGETLAQRIGGGPIALDDALAMARQLADALEHAHAKGIIHRDLKPANIKTGARDHAPHVKVLDFGLAKAMLPDAAGASSSALSSPTITSPATLTRAGVVLGTAAYMAPEQARGKLVDQRADIWAFGCVLYEMLSGRRAFDGDDVADVLARVIQSEPDWSRLPASTPVELRSLLRRCLRKDPHHRAHSIADVRIELDDIINSPAHVRVASSATPARTWFGAVAGVAAGAVVAAIAVLMIGGPQPRPLPLPLMRFSITTPDGWTLYRSPINGRASFAISPDGDKLAAVLSDRVSRKIFIRRLRDLAFEELSGTEQAEAVFWAPDSQRLGFVVGGTARQIDLSGGGSRAMATLPQIVTAAWGPDDVILASMGANRPLVRWPATGGATEFLEDLPSGVVARAHPRWLPGGTNYLFVEYEGKRDFAVKMQQPGRTREIKAFESGPGPSTYLDYQSGKLLLLSTEGSGRTVLTAESFDPTSGTLGGDASVIVTDVNPTISASATGTLVYVQGRSTPERFVWLDHQGAARAAPETLRPIVSGTNFDLSPDERYVVAHVPSGQPLELHDLTRGVTSTLQVVGGDPIWLPNGREFVYSAATGDQTGIFLMPAFGGSPKLIYPSPEPVFPEDWAANGRWLAAVRSAAGGLLIPVNPSDKAIEFGEPDEAIDEVRFTPDSRWIAYSAQRNVVTDVFLSMVPATGERWQVSVAGGAQPRWRADGRALYFLDLTGDVMMVDVELVAGRPPAVSAPRMLFDAAIRVQPTRDQFEVSKDGRRFLFRRPIEGALTALDTFQVIVNWPLLLTPNGGATQRPH